MAYNSAPPQVSANPDQSRTLQWLLGGAIALVWGYVMLPELTGVLPLLRTLSPFNIVLLVGAAVVLLTQGIRHRQTWLMARPRFHFLPLLVTVGAAIAAVLARWRLDLEQLSVITIVVGAYGLVGLFCQAKSWRRGLPFLGAFTVLVGLLLLEFTDLGHLARSGIADVVAHLLRPYSAEAIPSEDILVLSTGMALIDVPCSGFKGIEIGSLLFVVASLLERKHLGVRWLGVGLANVAMLLAANVMRILVLVALTFVAQQPTLAEVIHVPLGLSGFITACLVTLYLLRFVPRQQPKLTRLTHYRDEPPAATPATLRPAAIALGLLVALALVPQPTAIATTTSLDGLPWPAAMPTHPIALTPHEQDFFARYPGVVAQKRTFQTGGVTGSMILVASPTWQAHHAPELCYLASGMGIDAMQKATLTDQVTGRWLSLGQQRAAYWFQSSERTTGDYLDRVWREITRRDPQWTLASVLFDQSVSANDTDVRTALAAVHSAIAQANATPAS